MIIAIDFDGTCVTHDFPRIGKDIGAAKTLRDLTEHGHKLILFTMRSDRPALGETGDPNIKDESGLFLTEALQWFETNKIPLWGINTNPDQKNWTSSPKAYAELYIDDAALGCPLLKLGHYSDRPFVDWLKVRLELIRKGLLSRCATNIGGTPQTEQDYITMSIESLEENDMRFWHPEIVDSFYQED